MIPDNTDAYYQLSELHYSIGDADLALKYLDFFKYKFSTLNTYYFLIHPFFLLIEFKSIREENILEKKFKYSRII